MDLTLNSNDGQRSCSESDNNCLNSTSKFPESDKPVSPSHISKVDLNKFNSYPDVSNVPVINSLANDDLYVESPIGQGMGTRLSARNTDCRLVETGTYVKR